MDASEQRLLDLILLDLAVEEGAVRPAAIATALAGHWLEDSGTVPSAALSD